MKRKRSVLFACALSVLQPGLGHLYVGKPLYAVAIPVAVLLVYLMVRLSGFIFQTWGAIALSFLLIAAWLVIILSSGSAAKRAGARDLSRYQRWYVYVGYFVVVWAAFQGALAHWSQWFGFETYHLPTASMADTLLSGDYIIADSWAYRAARQPQRGDLVICSFPASPRARYVRRVIGLPGDEIVNNGRHILINNVQLDEAYVAPTHNIKSSAISFYYLVPPDSVFVLGDNRDSSYDSREVGAVSRAAIFGHVRTIWFSYDSKIGIRVNRIGMLMR
jgi:signal peptidase I